MSIVGYYIPLFGILLVVLSVRTLLLRRKLKIGIGDNDNVELKRAMRVHANFIEYTPLAILLIYFLEQTGGYSVWIHVLCIALLAGRIIHAYGVSQIKEDLRFRVVGMALTFLVILSTSVRLLFAAISTW
ncbi:MAG: MAPEG family protein [Acidiferrobacterales bacterium]|nr:MAPEG family protein [Acidiferrobacterales bacterium]